MADIVDTLRALVSDNDVLTGGAITARATSYWNAEPTRARAIVFPRTTNQVSAILKACNDARQTIVTQGGLTGVVQGAESSGDDIILSLERMNAIENIDPIGGTATVQAGAVLQTVQEQVAEQGFLFPLDLGARGSCTIGGNVSTNAGGINVIRYGMMRQLVLGLEAVLPNGTVLTSMNRMLKNNAGFDLKQLFIGTEGTLGVVTRVVLRLFPAPLTSQSAMVAMNDFASVAGFLRHCQKQFCGALSAYEVMWGDYYRAVTDDGGHRPPLPRDYSFYVVLTMEGSDQQADEEKFQTVLGDALAEGEILDAVLPQSERETRAIWQVREDFEPILRDPPFYLYDVSLPIADMGNYVKGVEDGVIAHWPKGETFTLGHIGDGNLHFFVSPFDIGATHDEADEIVYGPLAAYGGSVSAEHGIGIEKRGWLGASRTAEEVALMRSLKRTLDPKNILNPGVVVPAD